MHRLTRISAVALIFLSCLLIVFWRLQNPKRIQSQEPVHSPTVLAALGLVEGRGQPISLGAAADGVIQEVLVTDGQKVKAGDLLAVIGCEDVRAQIDLATAEAESARQARRRVLRGHRKEERAAAAQRTDAAQAVLTQAEQHLKRMDALYRKGEISRDAFEQTKRDFEVARADYRAAVDEQKLIDAGPLPEEKERADDEVAAADHNVKFAMDRLEKCNVRAPITGTILKVMTKVGESYSTLLPRPLFTVVDDSVRRVRAEVDERDIGKVKLGQAAIITADAYPGEQFDGRVIQISRSMSRKSVLSDDPAQMQDRDVLDVLIELKPSKQNLPIGLRVTAQLTNNIPPVTNPSEGLSANPRLAPGASSPQAPQATDPPDAQLPSNSAGFVLQAGAMAHPENAAALSTLLRKKGFPVFIAVHNGSRLNLVDVGPYPDLKSTESAKSQLQSEGIGTIIERRNSDQSAATASQ